jgi:Ca2+-binding EF-hand superfamily protein
MRNHLLVALLAVLALAADQPSAQAGADVQDLLLQGGQGPARLRLSFEIDGQPAHVAWETFLDRLFAFYDTNGDGFLDAREAARIFPLPRSGSAVQGIARVRDAALAKDGRIGREQLKAYYRKSGFAPIVVWEQPPSATGRQLSEALFQHLDQDRDGKLSQAELEAAPALLWKLDQDEDEVLTAAELLPEPTGQSSPPAKPHREKGLILAVADELQGPSLLQPPELELSVQLTVGKEAVALLGTSRNSRALPRDAQGTFLRRSLPGVTLTFDCIPHGGQAGRQTAVNFYRYQFKSALGEAKYLERTQIQQNPALRFLQGIWEYADRNGDGRLTLEELEAFLDLVEQGSRCQAVVLIRDEGRNLFSLLDTNRDGQLDLRELRQAGRLLSAYRRKGQDGISLGDLPRQVEIRFQQGLPNSLLGPTPAAGLGRQGKVMTHSTPRGPLWFRKMDRNKDGYVSPREFLGAPDLFRRLDKDGDGLISVEEAEQTESLRQRK